MAEGWRRRSAEPCDCAVPASLRDLGRIWIAPGLKPTTDLCFELPLFGLVVAHKNADHGNMPLGEAGGCNFIGNNIDVSQPPFEMRLGIRSGDEVALLHLLQFENQWLHGFIN